MIKAIIVDDEKDGAEVLEILIKQNCPGIKLLAIERNVENAVLSIKEKKPDLVFLDIEMPTGTGFEVIELTKDIGYETIFITAYEHYAIKAFKTNAIDYLLKPIDVDELISAVKNAEKRINATLRSKSPDIENLILNTLNRNKKISISSSEGVLLLDTTDIIRLEADSNYTQVYLKDKRKLTVAKTLKNFDEQLSSADFIRVHSAHLVNMNEVEKYIKGDGGIIVLKDKTSIPVSRAHKNELMEKLGL